MGSLVSLVMTDIVGSTRRWAADEVAMAADLETHDRVVREVVEGAGGSVFKHTGDGMIAVFDDPVAAVGAAASIQQTIGATSWRHPDGVQVRAAVHTGVVYRRDGDMFGTAMNRVARLLGTCPPAGVLVSNAAAGLLADRAPEGVELRSVGRVELAGFATPEEVFAVVGAGVNAEAVARADGGPTADTSLPPIEGELVGRVVELQAVWDALGRSPIVTLIGVGGMGKTRLALEVAHGAVEAFPDGVWWIDLATATSGEAVVPVVMAATGVSDVQGRTPLEAVCDRFADRCALMVFDNCEHVLERASAVVTALVNACPAARVVCTSREALGLRREQVLPVGSLPEGDGLELFVERTLAVRPDLDLVADRDVIARLCERLDGIPLAIELAAARCRSMTPAEVLERLDDRFRLLRGGRTGAERHRTLRAAVEWSYEMLDTDERAVFDTMAVFAGGALIDAIAAVSGFHELDALDIVDRLVARSMVVATTTRLGTRYHQLETLRQFAEDRLVEAGEFDAVRDRHLSWTQQFATEVARSTGTRRANDLFRRFTAEIDNLRVAVGHAITSGRREVAHEIVAAVAYQAIWLPAWEVVDWVTPVQVTGAWTPAAARCAALARTAELQRSPTPSCEYPIAGVPEEFVLTDPAVTISQASAMVNSGGDWRRSLELLDRIRPRTDAARCIVNTYRAMAMHFQQASGQLTDEELTDLVELCRSTIDTARRLGDDVNLGRVLAVVSFAMAYSFPSETQRMAAEAMEIGERTGAKYIADMARTAYHYALGMSVISLDEAARLQNARSLHRAITAALADNAYLVGGVMAFSAGPLIASTDPTVAALMTAAWTRQTAVPGLPMVEALGIPMAEYQEVVDARLPSLTLREVIEMVLAALDRFIAAADGEGVG
jgi:predicted ATPase/class 3 adenylate cyclase